MQTFTATAPDGTPYTFTASKAPAAVRFLATQHGWAISHHRTVAAASTSFLTGAHRHLMRPDSIVTDIRPAATCACGAEVSEGDGVCGMCR